MSNQFFQSARVKPDSWNWYSTLKVTAVATVQEKPVARSLRKELSVPVGGSTGTVAGSVPVCLPKALARAMRFCSGPPAHSAYAITASPTERVTLAPSLERWSSKYPSSCGLRSKNSRFRAARTRWAALVASKCGSMPTGLLSVTGDGSATFGAYAMLADPQDHRVCARTMRVPRRFCRMTDGSSDDWPTRVRVLTKSGGLKPRADPLRKLLRPAS